MSQSRPGLLPLAASTAVAVYTLIVVGAIVRATGSGLGCPDWPLCHGQIVPPSEATALTEFSHRLLGGIASLLVLAVAVNTWRRPRAGPLIAYPAASAVALVVVQVLLGAATVLLELPAMVVLAHLGVALLLLGATVWVAAVAWASRPGLAPGGPTRAATTGSGHIRAAVWLAVLAVYALAVSGAYMRASGASWVCLSFPTCAGAWLPSGQAPLVDIHLLHRLAAAATAAMLIALAASLWRSGAGRAASATSAAVAWMALLLIQAGLGVLMVASGPTTVLQVLHVAGAAALWASVVAVAAITEAHLADPKSSLPPQSLQPGASEGMAARAG